MAAWLAIQDAIGDKETAEAEGVILSLKAAVQSRSDVITRWRGSVGPQFETERDKGFRDAIEDFLLGTAGSD